MEVYEITHKAGDKASTLKQVRKARLDSKLHWYQLNITTDEGTHRLKCYGTTIQRHQHPNGAQSGGLYDMSVKDFNEEITKHL